MPDAIEKIVGDDTHLEEDDDATAYQRQYDDDHSWEELQEDAFGNLVSLDAKQEQRAKRKRLISAAASARIKRGMIRYLQLIVDYSAASAIGDMRPTRAVTVSRILQTFIREFFDQNPLSHIGIIAMRNGRAEPLTDLSGSPENHISKLRDNTQPVGEASLQNAIQTAIDALTTIPPYGNREVVIVFSAMSTCDPGNINDTIKIAKDAKCRISIVGLAAEVYICRQIVEATGGTYEVAKDENHLTELILHHSPPPPIRAAESAASMVFHVPDLPFLPPSNILRHARVCDERELSARKIVRMGFPKQNASGPNAIAFLGPECMAKSGGYTCPRCKALVVDIPSTCHICKLTLVSSPHLARSYHHLFPVNPFEEIQPAELTSGKYKGTKEVEQGNDTHMTPAEEWRETEAELYCFGCMQAIVPLEGSKAEDPGVIVKCKDCLHIFCFDCDTYIHESLHNCPGCECLGSDEMPE